MPRWSHQPPTARPEPRSRRSQRQPRFARDAWPSDDLQRRAAAGSAARSGADCGRQESWPVKLATNWPPNRPKSGQLAGKLRIPLPGFEPRSCRRRSNRHLGSAAQAERTFPSNHFAARSTSRPARGAIGARRPTRPASARPRVFERAALLPAISEVANRDCRPRRSASSRASNPSGVPALPRADGAERLNARIPHSARAAATEPSYRRRSRRGTTVFSAHPPNEQLPGRSGLSAQIRIAPRRGPGC